ncbi:MAG: ABC transporter substrate-binding protein, partial [Actinomycetota bacterium]|nr:ABC transporter substrate-binding protein [Actinomycetota bacterium]
MSFLNKKSGVVRRVAAVAILGIGLTACGSDDSADEPAEEEAATEEVAEEPAAEEPAAEEPTGDPIKVMTVTTLNANGPTYENIKIAAEIAADHIKSNGGINGRPLEVIVCDEQFDPAIAATCARDAVAEDVVSVVGSFTYFAEAI